MTFRDRVVVSAGNLRRLKLRTALTIAGILIAIAAFVSMLSFGAGNQAYVAKQFNELGLFSTIHVFPKTGADTAGARKLDGAAMEQFSAIPGVNLVYAYDAFAVKVRCGDSVVSAKAQALPPAATKTKLFSHLLAGRGFEQEDSRSLIITDVMMRKLGIASADSAIGRPIVVSVKVSTLDSALAHLVEDRGESLIDRARKIRLDSLRNQAYRSRVLHTELNAALRRFANGFITAQEVISDTLAICGVRSSEPMGNVRVDPVIMPIATAKRFRSGGFSANPADFLSSLAGGSFLPETEDASAKTFTQVTVDFDPKVPYTTIRDSIEARGFKTFSFAAEFEEIQRVFLYFDLALGLIGLIALSTASLGIVNTMVMSITERRKEIGILKSLGADDSDIRALFLVESGIIGLLGTVGGICFGWMIARVASAVAQAYMKSKGVGAIDLFALPPWLILIALATGVAVSVLAGFYPAARASRVDPVEALRGE
jgi:ABC-type lipoprotein release transport system permease subunit